MIKSLISKYQAKNPEQFNDKFIRSRSNDSELLSSIKDIFKSLEVLAPVKIIDVWIEDDESQLIPPSFAESNSQTAKTYTKPVDVSRLIQVYYTYEIDLSKEDNNGSNAKPSNRPMRGKKTTEDAPQKIRETKYFYLNKLVDDLFFINEGSRYFLIYQVVDIATYGSGRDVSLKSLMMPITMRRKADLVTITSQGDNQSFQVPVYELFLFRKKINPLIHIMGNLAYQSLSKIPYDPDTIIHDRAGYVDENLMPDFCKFMNADLKFADDIKDLMAEDRYVFQIPKGPFVSVDKKKMDEKDPSLYSALGSFFDLRDSGSKKKTVTFTAEDIKKPIFWSDILSGYFSVNTDPIRKFEKTKTMVISLNRLIDGPTRNILRLPDKDKESTLAILRYMMRDFDAILHTDSRNFKNKRLRMTEYQLYCLRTYFSDQIYRVLNSPMKGMKQYTRIFSNLKSMHVIKHTVTNELLRYYNTTNELNFFTMLKYTQKGPQSLMKVVSNATRDVDASHFGRVSLVSSAAGDPGISGCLVPFVEVDNGYFVENPETD